MPSGFERYLRIFHPFQNKAAPSSGNNSTSDHLSWKKMAERLGVPFHPSLLHQLLLPFQERERSAFELQYGNLEPKAMNALVGVLESSSDTVPVFFYYGLSAQIRNPDHQPLMWRGQLADIWEVQQEANMIMGEHIPHSPEWIWPEDRRWLVLTDYDLPSTYVAAGSGVADAILQQAELEVHEVNPDTPLNEYK
jgi:hypothetical protein